MSEVLHQQKPMLTQSKQINMKTTPRSPAANAENDYDEEVSSSIIEFLAKEQECCADVDADSIFEEVSRLADSSDNRSVEEIIHEAELLIRQQNYLAKDATKHKNKINSKQKVLTEHNGAHQKNNMQNNKYDAHLVSAAAADKTFNAFIDNLPSESIISEESTPKEMLVGTTSEAENTLQLLNGDINDDDDEDAGTDTMEEITEAIGSIGLIDKNQLANSTCSKKVKSNKIATTNALDTLLLLSSATANNASLQMHTTKGNYSNERRYSCEPVSWSQNSTFATLSCAFNSSLASQHHATASTSLLCDRNVSANNQTNVRRSSATAVYESPTKCTTTNTLQNCSSESKSYCDKSVNCSPKRMVSVLTSPIHSVNGSINREHALKQEIELLQEKLKDTEERLQSLRIQHDSLTQLHRDLRESNTHLQEESEKLKLDVQHLNDCANILRSELQAARADRNEALELQKVLQTELETTRQEKKQALELKDKDGKVIQDLQRQCREMERILMRKHPDSVSALIVASKNPGKGIINDHENPSSRKLLEQRIAQLEADAKEQDLKAQQILANVQARFNSVQAKYETHIADLETQVLSLQEINTKLNEKIESQVRTLNYFVAKKAEKYYNNCTQTEFYSEDTINSLPTGCTSSAGTQTNELKRIITRDHSTNTIGSSSQHSASSSTSSTANSTPNNSRPNSKQSGIRKPANTMSSSLSTALISKLPVSHSDSTISHATNLKEETHLLTALRGMRVDLAIKDKAVQRLTRELEECKKTIRKLQTLKTEKSHFAAINSNGNSKVFADSNDQSAVASTDTQALKDAQSKIKLLEADYKILHDKRLQDLKTLQTAHERELDTCHETVRVLQQRLNEREEAFATQKRRKVPVDYYALKAKVSSLERRHTEREERLHLLVEALSKGRFNGALDSPLKDANNS